MQQKHILSWTEHGLLLRVPWTARRSKPVHPKGDQSWMFIGRPDVEAETPILWSPDVKSWLIWKDPDAGKDWGQEEKGTAEDEMVGWHHQLEGHGFWWSPGVGDGQGGPVCCSSWGHGESDTTERLNWTESTVLSAIWMVNMQRERGSQNHMILLNISCVCSVAQLCLPLCDPMDCILPGSSVRGIF